MMGQQVSVTKLKEQIEAAKRGLAEMSPAVTAADPLIEPAATSAANFACLIGGHENDVPDGLGQSMVSEDDMAATDMVNDDVATSNNSQFFHRPKRSDQPFAPLSPMSMVNVDTSTRDRGQPLFQMFDQRLDRLEGDIVLNHKLITLLSGLDMSAKPTRQNKASVKYFLRRNLYWFVIGLLVIGWGALTRSGHYWINQLLGLI
jgi:hypothetical protein